VKPTCVAFDLDDTLYLERDYVRSGFHAVEDWARKNLGLEDFSSRAWGLFQQGERGNIFDLLLLQSGITPEKNVIGSMVDLYRRHKPDIKLPADAAECLRDLRGRVRLALISDGVPLSQRNKIDALGLAQFFDTIVLTSELGDGFTKPHPRSFSQVQQTSGEEVQRYVYVADNPLKDFLGPRSLGWKTIRIRREGGLYSSLEGEGYGAADVEMMDLSALASSILGGQ